MIKNIFIFNKHIDSKTAKNLSDKYNLTDVKKVTKKLIKYINKNIKIECKKGFYTYAFNPYSKLNITVNNEVGNALKKYYEDKGFEVNAIGIMWIQISWE